MKIQWSLGEEGREKGRSCEDGLISVGAGKPTLRAIKLVPGLESWVGWESRQGRVTQTPVGAAKPRLLILREETASLRVA